MTKLNSFFFDNENDLSIYYLLSTYLSNKWVNYFGTHMSYSPKRLCCSALPSIGRVWVLSLCTWVSSSTIIPPSFKPLVLLKIVNEAPHLCTFRNSPTSSTSDSTHQQRLHDLSCIPIHRVPTHCAADICWNSLHLTKCVHSKTLQCHHIDEIWVCTLEFELRLHKYK